MRTAAPRAPSAPRAASRSTPAHAAPAPAARSAAALSHPRPVVLTSIMARAPLPASSRTAPNRALATRVASRPAHPVRRFATAPSSGDPAEPPKETKAAEGAQEKTATKARAKKAAVNPEAKIPPPGTSMVVNLQDKRIDDAALGVRTFIIASLEAAQRFPVQVESPVWSTENDGRCGKCKGVVSPCVVTTFPVGETGPAAEAQEKLWSAYPVALDGVVCRSCSALTAPRFVTAEEFQKLSKAGLKEAKGRNFGMAEFLLRRCANAFPEYLYARLNLGSLFMDKLGVEESVGKDREDVRKRYFATVKSNFEACLLPETKPPNRVPGKVYTTLARIYLDPLKAAKILQRLLGVLEKFKKADDKEALEALDFNLAEDVTYAQSLLSKALAGMQAAAIKAIRMFAYYGDAEARLLSETDHAVLSAAVDTLNLILACLQQPPERYGYLLNVDRYALYYFLGKAMQVLGKREQAAGWFIEANKNAQLKERRIEAVTEYAGDLLHCRKAGEGRESLDKAIALIKETKEACGDPDGNLGSSLGMLYLAVGEVAEAERVLEQCVTETGASLAEGLLKYVPAARAGGSAQWRFEKSGNRLYISKGDEAAAAPPSSEAPGTK